MAEQIARPALAGLVVDCPQAAAGVGVDPVDASARADALAPADRQRDAAELLLDGQRRPADGRIGSLHPAVALEVAEDLLARRLGGGRQAEGLVPLGLLELFISDGVQGVGVGDVVAPGLVVGLFEPPADPAFEDPMDQRATLQRRDLPRRRRVR